ncbi:MAG: hypothetical protein ABFD44_07765 [Anaerolineaceae bacterium]
MAEDKQITTVKVMNDKGASMMSMHSFGREGDQMTIVGSLLGAWESTMYVDPEEVPKMIKLLLNWQVIGYILSVPFLIRKRKKHLDEN